MQMTVTEAYAREALKQATVEQTKNGEFVARVPGLRGVLAFGTTYQDALVELYTVVEDWARVGVQRKHRIPVMGAIDLNTEENRRLATYE